MASKPLLRIDIEHMLTHAGPAWEALRNSRIFVTGGTGFFGKWLLEAIAAANDELHTNITLTILSRNPNHFQSEMPHLAARKDFIWHIGDIRNFDFPIGHFDYVLHMATAASEALNQSKPLEMLDTIVQGTRHVLSFCQYAKVKRMLLTSSGAIYGPQPAEMSHIPETHLGGPDPLQAHSAYAEGKRMAELLCTLSPDVETVIARCFAFIGPHLPLNAHFAAGNFIRDVLEDKAIQIKGNPATTRSYMYAADMLIALLQLLTFGIKGNAYNVGSEQALTLKELAQQLVMVAKKNTPIHINPQPNNTPPSMYIPSTTKSNRATEIYSMISLENMLNRTLCWHLSHA